MLVALSALVPSMALAAPTPDSAHIESLVNQITAAGDQRDQLFASFSPEDQKAVITALTPVRVVVENAGVVRVSDGTRSPANGISPMASGCWTADPTVVAYGSFGNVLYKYGTHYYWCGNGSTIYYHDNPTRILFTDYWWSFEGDIDYWENGGNGSDHFRVYRQGKMRHCLYGGICTDTRYPRMDSVVYGNGSYGILDWGT